MHARLADGKAQLLTRTGLDWSKQYGFTIEALLSLPAKTFYLDGELCALLPDGVPAFLRDPAILPELALMGRELGRGRGVKGRLARLADRDRPSSQRVASRGRLPRHRYP